MNDSLREGDVYERVGPLPWSGGPEPGDRYAVTRPWTNTTGLRAIGRTIGGAYQVVFISSLSDPTLWRRVDHMPSMLEVLIEELKPLRAVFSIPTDLHYCDICPNVATCQAESDETYACDDCCTHDPADGPCENRGCRELAQAADARVLNAGRGA